VIPLNVLHIIWTKLSFSNISSNESLSRLCIEKEIEMVVLCRKSNNQTKFTWNCVSYNDINGTSNAKS